MELAYQNRDPNAHLLIALISSGLTYARSSSHPKGLTLGLVPVSPPWCLGPEGPAPAPQIQLGGVTYEDSSHTSRNQDRLGPFRANLFGTWD